MVPSNGANAQRRTESACIGADSLPTAKCKRKIETLIPAILMVLQHQYGPKQWCKCAAARRIGLHRRGQPPDRQVNRKIETLIPAILMVLQHQHGPKQ
jgi:hypothetical protein